NEHFVGAGAGLAFGGKFAKRTGVFGIGDGARFKAQIPDIPVIDAAIRVLFATVALVEHDAGVGPDCAGELVVKAGGKHRPLAAEGVADDADASRIHLGSPGQDRVRV